MLCHAINQLHEHKANRATCTQECAGLAAEDECCSRCCGPCGALAWIMTDDRDWWDELVRINTTPDITARYGQGWGWQLPNGSVNWEALENCWKRADGLGCWHSSADEDDGEPDEVRLCPKCSEADAMNWHGDGMHCEQGRQAYVKIVTEAEWGYTPEELRVVEVPVSSHVVAIGGMPLAAPEDDTPPTWNAMEAA